MHPLRVFLIVSLALAIAVASAFGALLVRVGVSTLEAVVLAALVFIVFLLPWAGVSVWAMRRAADLDELIDRTMAFVEGAEERSFTERMYEGELGELARAVEEVRGMLVRQRLSFAEHRAAVEQIVASLGEGLLAVSAKGRVVFANERVSAMFGTRGALVGATVAEVVRKHSVIAALDHALHGRASVDRISSASEEGERQIEIRTFPVTPSGEIAAVALFIDVTEIERLQKIRREFIDDFSHEVRTPLAGVRSAVETLDAGQVSAAQEQELRRIMLRQLNRLERLVQDLSELYRIESGELVLDRRPVALDHLLADLCHEFSGRAAADHVRFTLRSGESRTTGDPVRLQQVFSNLLDNAWKYGAAPGEVIIEVSRENADAVVRVSDEGEGIPAGEADRIFNRFYRVDRSRSQKVPGLGLGLAITKHLVLMHGGGIRAFNRATGGATFEVRLPAS